MVPHTLVVDFAVALLITSVVCDLVAQVAEEDEFRIVAHWTLILGTLAAGFAVLSGYAAYGAAAPSGAAGTIVLRHRNMALATLACTVPAAAWRVYAHGHPPERYQGLYWTLVGASILALLVTAYLGGTAVFQYGVGVR